VKLLAGTAIGIVFGIVISWSGMASPEIIRDALLFEQAYLFLMFASAVAIASLGLALLRRRERAALLTGEPLTYGRDAIQRRHIVGSLVFGIGWAVADACPAPIAAQIGQGVPWAVFTLTGVAFGVWLFLRRGVAETEPAADAPRAIGNADVLAQPISSRP
jgi:uncharacterized membrane protein YedE/YeeE